MTLIEVLTAMAVISILGVILFPVWAQARERARQTACLSNLRQIASAQTLYSQDWDEAMLPWRNTSASVPLSVQVASTWTTTIQPYLHAQNVLFCPSFRESALANAINAPNCDGANYAVRRIPARQYLAHYGIATRLTRISCDRTHPRFRYPGSGWGRDAGRAESNSITFFSAVVVPARTVGVGDAYTLVTPDGAKVTSGFGCEARYRHGNGGNFAMLDGHARYLPGDAEGYAEQDAEGCWFETYFTFDR